MRGAIVVGVDFGPAAEIAARFAARLAARRAGTLTLVHVEPAPLLGTVAVEPLFVPPALLEALRGRRERIHGADLAYLEERLRDEVPGLVVDHHLGLGDPAEALLAAAAARDAALIVLASRGRGALRAWIGGVTARVAARATCPIVVAGRRDDGDAAGRVRRVVAAIDLGPASAEVVRVAADLVEPGGAIELAHVWGQPRPRFGPAPSRPSEAGARAWADHRLAALAALVAPGRDVDRWIGDGEPATALLDHAAVAGVDLLVLGAHGARHGLGAVVDRVLRRVDAPVVAIVPPHASGAPAPRPQPGVPPP
jgi:nucleotide-binding universal stress UspA family protein